MAKKQKFFNSRKKKEINYLQMISAERVTFLMEKAIEIHAFNKPLANRYVSMSRKIASGAKIRIPRQFKQYICRGCKKLIIPGRNSYVRIRSLKGEGTHITTTCLECGKRRRIYFRKKKIEKISKNRGRKINESEQPSEETDD